MECGNTIPAGSSNQESRAVRTGHTRNGRHRTDRYDQDPHAPASALRLPGLEDGTFSRYTPEMVERACGVPQDLFFKIAEPVLLGIRSGEDRGDLLRARMDPAFEAASQIIRRRRSCSCCSATSGGPAAASWRCAVTPRSRARPTFRRSSTSFPVTSRCRSSGIRMILAAYVGSVSTTGGMWANLDKYIVSLLKAYYGDAATKENDLGFRWLPRVTGDHSHMGYWLDMADGKVEGLFVMGREPRRRRAECAFGAQGDGQAEMAGRARSRRNGNRVLLVRLARGRARRAATPRRSRPKSSCLPAAGHAEKDGTFTNTQRLLQWHEKAVDPPGDARSESWFIYHLGRRLKEKAKADPRPRNAGLNALTWELLDDADRRRARSPKRSLQEINGYRVADRTLVPGFGELRAMAPPRADAGSTRACFPRPGENRANERQPRDAYGHGWGFAWPADRRILYNRASARPDGQPWSERKKLVWWDEHQAEWTGLDVPDFTKTKPPDYQPPPDARGGRGARRRQAVHHACRWRRLDLGARRTE